MSPATHVVVLCDLISSSGRCLNKNLFECGVYASLFQTLEDGTDEEKALILRSLRLACINSGVARRICSLDHLTCLVRVHNACTALHSQVKQLLSQIMKFIPTDTLQNDILPLYNDSDCVDQDTLSALTHILSRRPLDWAKKHKWIMQRLSDILQSDSREACVTMLFNLIFPQRDNAKSLCSALWNSECRLSMMKCAVDDKESTVRDCAQMIVEWSAFHGRSTTTESVFTNEEMSIVHRCVQDERMYCFGIHLLSHERAFRNATLAPSLLKRFHQILVDHKGQIFRTTSELFHMLVYFMRTQPGIDFANVLSAMQPYKQLFRYNYEDSGHEDCKRLLEIAQRLGVDDKEINVIKIRIENLEFKHKLEVRKRKLGVHVDVPTEFVCPITQEVMTDPVVASDGHSYERSAIWTYMQNSTKSPMTRETLDKRVVVNNINLKKRIREYEQDVCNVVESLASEKKFKV